MERAAAAGSVDELMAEHGRFLDTALLQCLLTWASAPPLAFAFLCPRLTPTSALLIAFQSKF